MRKSSKSSLKKRSLDISLQHKNQPTYKFSKINLHLADKRAGAERVKKNVFIMQHRIFHGCKNNFPGLQ